MGMHQNFEDDYDWKESSRPMWIERLADDLAIHVEGGWSNTTHMNNALTFLGMLEIDQILAPILRAAIGPIHILWPKGTNERLEVIINAPNQCHVVKKLGEFTKEEYDCSPLGMRNALLKFYPFIKNNFDRKFTWTGKT